MNLGVYLLLVVVVRWRSFLNLSLQVQNILLYHISFYLNITYIIKQDDLENVSHILFRPNQGHRGGLSQVLALN